MNETTINKKRTFERDNICIGLLTQSTFFALSYPQKILFERDSIENRGYDIGTHVYFPLSKPNKKGILYISNTIELGKNMKELGFPQILTEEDIQKFIQESFEEVIIQSGYLQKLHFIAMESYSPNFYRSFPGILLTEFGIQTESENKAIQKYKKTPSKK